MSFLDETGLSYFWSKLKERLETPIKRIAGNASVKTGEIAVYDDPDHGAGISYDNTYALYDGTAPSISIDGTVIPLMRRSQFDYKTTVNLDNIRAGAYWINGYGSTITGSKPFTNTHYLLISTGTNTNTMQCAINTSASHEVKMRYRANGGAWGAWA